MKMTIPKPPRGLTGTELHTWYEDQAGTLATEHYEGELFKQRDARRKAEAERDEAQQALKDAEESTPGEGDVILKGDDAKRWEELKGVDVKALQQRAEEADRLAEEQRLHNAADALGLKKGTFTEFINNRKLTVRNTSDDDSDPQYVVVTKGEKGEEENTDVMEYLEEHAADWLPALVAEDSGRQERESRRPTPPLGRLPSGSQRRRGTSAEDDFLKRRREAAQKTQNVLAQKFKGGQ